MKAFDIKLTKENWAIIIAVAIGVGAIILCSVCYAPLLKRLKMAHSECTRAEAQVFETRNIIDMAAKSVEKRTLASEKDAALAIDELTRYGKEIGINFRSIRPMEVSKEKDSYCILPINMEVEGGVQQLGAFLGSLDELKGSPIKVRSFNIVADKDKMSKLRANIVVEICLALDEEAAGQGTLGYPATKALATRRTAKKTEFVGWARNIFVPKSIPGTASSQLTLGGIMWDEKNPKALIGQAIVEVGDKVGSYTVIEIKRDRVIVGDGEKNFELRLKQ